MLFTLGDRRPSLPADGSAFVADNACIIGSVELKRNSSVWFATVLRGDNDQITIGEGSNIQDGSVLHTDAGIQLTVGNNVTVGHKVMLHGCQIGDNCLIGINAVVLNNAKVGPNCLIGANALVPEGREIPAGSLVLGSPGKIARELTKEEIEQIREIGQHYVDNGQRYRAKLKVMQAGE